MFHSVSVTSNSYESNVSESSRGAVVTTGSSSYSNNFTGGSIPLGLVPLSLRPAPGSWNKNDADWRKARYEQQVLLQLRHASSCQHETVQMTHTPMLEQGLSNNVSLSIVPQSKTDTSPSKVEKESTESILQASAPFVYECPFGKVVSILRSLSLCTTLIGMTGVPCMIALKGGTIPEAAILAAMLLFVSGSIGLTAAIHFVFSTYVYKIERICSSTSTIDMSAFNALEAPTGIDDIDNSVKAQNEATTTPIKDTLLKAWTRTLLLQNDAIIFDPTIDVQPYKGLRPMCNFLAKGRPLYVHPGT
jgi:hypothetical protein